MSTSDFFAVFFTIVVLSMCVASGWWAREFVYRLDHIAVQGCDTEGSCGNR